MSSAALDDLDDHLCIAAFEVALAAGETVTFVASDRLRDPAEGAASLQLLRGNRAQDSHDVCRVRRRGLPTYFPDGGESPEYNTVDAALCYVEAAAAYVAATGDVVTLRDIFPVLSESRSKSGRWWYNALRRLAALAPLTGIEARPMPSARKPPRKASHDTGTPSAVIATTSSTGRGLERSRAVVRACAAKLLAATGMRSLASSEPGYIGRYRGSPPERDAASHRGTSWLWLLPVFTTASARAFNDGAGARGFLDLYGDALEVQGVGTLGEIADGDAPLTARGAFAQALSVAEAIRAWHNAPRWAPAT